MLQPFKKIQPPELDFDKLMLERRNYEVSVRGRLERRIVANLCEYLIHHGWKPVEVYCGTWSTTTTTKEVMEALFDLEYVSVRFDSGSNLQDVELISGNGVGIISDYTYDYTCDPQSKDNFQSLMADFNAEDYL